MLSPNQKFEQAIFKAMAKVKKLYGADWCKQSKGPYCSHNELAIAQWFFGAISSNPPKPLTPGKNLKEAFNINHYSPEIYSFYQMKEFNLPEMTMDQVWELFDSGKLWNMGFVGDLLLGIYDEEDQWKNPQFEKFLRAMATQEGLKGFVVEKKVKDYIEGYTDKDVKGLS